MRSEVITVRTGTVPLEFADGVLRVAPGENITADRIVAMPKLYGPPIEGVPTDTVPEGDLLSVRLRARGETGAAEFIIDRQGDEAVVASNADGMTAQLRRVRMDVVTESELLSSTLVAATSEPVYEAALRAAGVFLASARSSEATG